MAKRVTYPNVERVLVDYLPSSTSFDWMAPGSHDVGSRVPVGIVERTGGSSGDVDRSPSVEVTVVAATRTGVWMLVQQVEAAFVELAAAPAGLTYIDDVREIFGFAIDPDRHSDRYTTATATYSLTLRPQE